MLTIQNYLKSLALAAATLVAAASVAFAQDTAKLSGTVVDENGEPLVGAAVMIKDSSTGTVTDLDGAFTLAVPRGATLVVSFIGFQDQEVVPGNRNNIVVTLLTDDKLLDEVVVIGYGTVKRKDLTGSVAAVRGEDLEVKRTTNLSTALQGTMSGVMVTRDNSAPGSGAGSIRVRGITTMGTSDPLIIVDGVQVSSLDYVNTADVESISVLKDAAAASIYGAKAAAGVILVTTKRGDKGDMSINYTGEFGMEIPTAEPDMVGLTRYLEMYNELLYNDNPTAGFFQQYTADQVKNWVKNNATDPDHYPITDWRGLMMKDFAPRQTHQLTVSGGNEFVRTKASLSYDEVGALYDGRKFQRYMLRTNNDFTIIKDKLYATLDINVRRGHNLTTIYDPFSDMRKTPAIYAAMWHDGRIAEGKSGANPYGLLLTSGESNSWSTQLGGKGTLEYRPFKGLSIQGVVSPFINYTKQKKFRMATYYTTMDDPEQFGGWLEGGGTVYSANNLSETRNDSYNITSQVLVNYHATFGSRHDFSALAGFENYITRSENLTASREFYELTQYPYLDVGPEDYQYNSGDGSEYTSNSFFGRIMYDYAGKYLLQANVRHDGSSRFARQYRWGTFPSVSAGWVVSEESFLQGARPWLSFLKLRASWGMLGNERIGSNYFPYLALISFNDALFYKDGEVVSNKTAAQRGLAVEDITWETTTSLDFGLDATFFSNRLKVGFDWYDKKTSDMLLDVEIPYMMGFTKPKTNAGQMSTRGWDLELGWNDRVGDFIWSVNANVSDFQSVIDNVNGADIINGSSIQREGEFYNAYYGYASEGIYQTQEQVDNSARLYNTVTVGDIRYKDISGPDGEPDGVINSEYDRVVLGNRYPRFQFGGNIHMAWRGIDAAVVFQGIGSKLAYMSTNMVQPLRDNYGNIPAILDDHYWSPFNTEEENAAAIYPRLTKTGISNNYAFSDFWMFDGGYFRLKNVTLGYTLPASLTQNVGIKRLRFYASASDLFCLSRYPKGWDPEMGATSYPITMSLLLGASIKF
ncbi:MAG: TonB-dependent receptor [Bacteroidales bacterium]|nr:TonB-dependent receptor [Bacteroidales bacterium]